jgi:hypothetical protein
VKAALTALAAAVAATLALGAGTTQPSAPTAAAKAAIPLYGISYARSGGELSRFDPVTLRPVGRVLRLPQTSPLWAFSPDGRELALATEREGLQLVRLDTMRVRARFRGRRLVRGLAWPAPRRLVLAEHGETLLVDPVAARIVRRQVRPGVPSHAERTRSGLVFLGTSGDEGIGPARLDVVGSDGRTRSVPLTRIRAGVDGGENNQGPWQSESPGLALDEAGNRAFVAGGSGRVAEIDLATLAVSYREPHEPRSLLSRVARWLQPSARAKAASGPQRTAAWLGGALAITGYDLSVAREEAVTWQPYGLRLFDPRTSELRTIDTQVTQLTAAGGLLLAHGSWYEGSWQTRHGQGLTAYRPDGTRIWHLFGDAPVETLYVAGRQAYVWAGGMLHAVDLAHGAVRASTRPAGMVVFLTAGSRSSRAAEGGSPRPAATDR